jgi:hypothetical protein
MRPLTTLRFPAGTPDERVRESFRKATQLGWRLGDESVEADGTRVLLLWHRDEDEIDGGAAC